MKYKGSININQSREKVTELFIDADNLKEYQDGFIKKELIEGNTWKMERFLKCNTNMGNVI